MPDLWSLIPHICYLFQIVNPKESKLFDPADGFAPITDLLEVTDASIAKRDNRWWMYLAGQRRGDPSVQLFSASLPAGAPLASAGWKLTPNPLDPSRIALLAGNDLSNGWDLSGGRHCPSYVRGWDPHRAAWVERTYYAGGAEQIWGPYTVGFLEWDGVQWRNQPAPAFLPTEPWERGSVYEPNLIYHDGKWKMWYVAGSNHEDYLVHGYAESLDGRTSWSPHKIFCPAKEKVFDFRVIEGKSGFEAVFSRVWVAKTPPPPRTGLWWCHAQSPSSNLSDWSEPVQIMTAEDRGWHAGPWKPSFHYDERDSNRLLIFFDGLRNTGEPGPFPFAFTSGCLEIDRPEQCGFAS